MSDLKIRKANRQGVRPIISIYAESGCGKSYSSLLLARGFVGPGGKVVGIDTEAGRLELYSDVPEIGGYEVLPLDAPFSPERYVEAMEIVEQSGAAIGICDQLSSEWDGPGGVLDMADQNQEDSKRPGLHNWRKPKLSHAHLIQKLLRSSIPWIVCLRAKYKTRQVKDNGKTVIVRDEQLSPLQSEEFIFESTCHGYVTQDHKFWQTKISHPMLAQCLPNGSPITTEHGRLLAQWCASPGGTVTPKPEKTQPIASSKQGMLGELRSITKAISGWNGRADTWESAKAVLETWLVSQTILADTEALSDLSLERLTEVLSETRAALNSQPQQLL